MKKIRNSIVVAVILALSAAPLAAAPFSPWDAWREAYNTFERGEQFRAKGDYLRAIEEFREARGQYVRVREARPDWNQKIISARINDCDQAIAAVQKLLGNAPAPEPVRRDRPESASAAASSSVSTGEVEFLKRELEKCKEKLLEATVEVDELRRRLAQNAAAAEEVANLLRDQRVMQEKYALLEKRYQTLERRALEPDTRNTELRNQLIEEKLNSEVVAKRLQLAEARIRKMEEEAAAQYTRQRTAETRSAEAAEAQRRSERELAELRTLRDGEARKFSALQQELEGVNARLAETLRQREAADLETASLRKQLQEALATGGNSASLNARLNEENRQLHAALDEAARRETAAREEGAALQGKLRELQLELVQVRETMQRLDESRKRLEQTNGELKGALERERSAAELNAAELRNLRERNRKLEADMQTWAAQCAKLEKRLESRTQEGYQAQAAAEQEKQRMTGELGQLRDALAGLKIRVEQAQKAQAAADGRAAAAEEELLRQKTAAASWEAKYKETQLALQRIQNIEPETAKLRQELADLRRNFQALQQENAEGRAARQRELQLTAELERSGRSLKELAALRAGLEKQQRENESLAERNRQLDAARQKLAAGQQSLLQELAAQKDAAAKAKAEAAEARAQAAAEIARQKDAVAEAKAAVAEARAQAAAEIAKGRAENDAVRRDAQAAADAAAAEAAKARAEIDAVRRNAQAAAETAKAEAAKAEAARAEAAEARAEIEAMRRSAPTPAVVVVPADELVPQPLPRKPEKVGTPAELTAAGREAETEEKIELALWNYKTAHELDPNHFESAFRLGMLYLKRGEYAPAEEALQSARRQHPELVPLAVACAEAQIGRGKYGNALATLDPLRAASPDDVRILVPSARALAGTGRFAEAAKLLERAAELKPGEAAPWLELARVRLYDGQSTEKEAADAYREARARGAAPDTELEPRLGKLLDEQRELNEFMNGAAREAEIGGDWDSALWYYRQLAEHAPGDRRYTTRIALLQLKEGKFAAAEETLTLNLPDTAEGFLILTLAQLGRADQEAARTSLDEVRRCSGGRPLEFGPDWVLLAEEAGKALHAPALQGTPILALLKSSVVLQ